MTVVRAVPRRAALLRPLAAVAQPRLGFLCHMPSGRRCGDAHDGVGVAKVPVNAEEGRVHLQFPSRVRLRVGDGGRGEE